MPFRQSQRRVARDAEGEGHDGGGETSTTEREVPIAEKAPVKRESRVNSGYASHISTTTAPKASKAQSLFKTEPWESTAKGAEVSESKALELLTQIEDEYQNDDKSDDHYAYGPEGNALYEKAESTRKMLENMHQIEKRRRREKTNSECLRKRSTP